MATQKGRHARPMTSEDRRKDHRDAWYQTAGTGKHRRLSPASHLPVSESRLCCGGCGPGACWQDVR